MVQVLQHRRVGGDVAFVGLGLGGEVDSDRRHGAAASILCGGRGERTVDYALGGEPHRVGRRGNQLLVGPLAAARSPIRCTAAATTVPMVGAGVPPSSRSRAGVKSSVSTTSSSRAA